MPEGKAEESQGQSRAAEGRGQGRAGQGRAGRQGRGTARRAGAGRAGQAGGVVLCCMAVEAGWRIGRPGAMGCRWAASALKFLFFGFGV